MSSKLWNQVFGASPKSGLASCLLVASAVLPLNAVANTLSQSKEVVEQTDKAGQKSQKRIESLDDTTQTMLQDYKQAVAETELLKVYNKQMEEIIANQEAEIASIDEQIRQIKYTEQGVLPLMNQMLATLEAFIQLDMPFLLKERETRLVNLKQLMTRADVTVSEKYRRVLEAYQIEVEFGRTLEVYKEKDDQQVLNTYLRVGRIGLYKASLDFSQAWAFNNTSKEWNEIDSGLLRDLKKAYSVAGQTSAPEILTLPLNQSSNK